MIKKVIALLSGFRKFIVIMLVISVGVIFRLFDLLNGLEMVDLLKGTVIAYMSFNGIEHMSKAIQEFLKKPSKKSNNTAQR
jgi:energy-converting hydrogenase Eha subunit B